MILRIVIIGAVGSMLAWQFLPQQTRKKEQGASIRPDFRPRREGDVGVRERHESFRARVDAYCKSVSPVSPAGLDKVKKEYRDLRAAEPETREGEEERQRRLGLVELVLFDSQVSQLEHLQTCESLVISGAIKIPSESHITRP